MQKQKSLTEPLKVNFKKKSKWKKKVKLKKKISPCRGSNPRKMVLVAVTLSNEPRKHRLTGNQIYNI